MSNLKLSFRGKGKKQKMFFGKSITFDEEDSGNAAMAANQVSAGQGRVDYEFIEKLRSGDAQAFDDLVNRYTGDIYALLLRITGDAKEAEDLTQDTFLQALRAIGKFRGDAGLKTWLFRIAINLSKNRFRWWNRRKRGQTVSIDAPVGDSNTPLSDTFASRSNDPEENLLQKERENLLNRALYALPEIFREAVILCDIEGLSYEEIAAVLGINIGTVKSRIARGREELRKKLKDL